MASLIWTYDDIVEKWLLENELDLDSKVIEDLKIRIEGLRSGWINYTEEVEDRSEDLIEDLNSLIRENNELKETRCKPCREALRHKECRQCGAAYVDRSEKNTRRKCDLCQK